MEELIRIMGKLGTTDEIVQVLPDAFFLLQPLARVFWNMRQYSLHKAFD